jgi:dTMP kinase
MAYQGYGRSLDRVLITELERIATRGLSPDMTIWLDLPLELSVQRRGSREEDRMEAEGFAFLERVAKGFSDLAKTRGWVSVVADRPRLEVAEAIQTALLTRAAAWQS